MADMIRNIVAITKATAEEYQEIKDLLRSEPDEETGRINFFDFNGVIPFPNGFRLEVPETTETKEAMDWVLLKNKAVMLKLYTDEEQGLIEKVAKEKLDKEYTVLGSKALLNVSEFGYSTAVRWQLGNWGTKWNASECSVWEDVSRTINFATPWTSPMPVFQRLSELYPSVEFEVTYFMECTEEHVETTLSFHGGDIKTVDD